jgi:hypothetical protein
MDDGVAAREELIYGIIRWDEYSNREELYTYIFGGILERFFFVAEAWLIRALG